MCKQLNDGWELDQLFADEEQRKGKNQAATSSELQITLEDFETTHAFHLSIAQTLATIWGLCLGMKSNFDNSKPAI